MPETGGSRAQSILHRLRNELRARGEDVSMGLHRYAVETFLYRLGGSRHRERYILKGGTLLATWGTLYRPTRDIDFTGYGNPDDLIGDVSEICETEDDVHPIVFDTASIAVDPIRDDSEYDGFRIVIRGQLGTSNITLQIDVGFGNDIVPGPQDIQYRTILGDPPPTIRGYPAESFVAEKLEAMVSLGDRNSRYKDFYDVFVIAREFPFDMETLVLAVQATFERRRTPLGAPMPAALTAPFYANDNRETGWRAYLDTHVLTGVPYSFQEIGDLLTIFLTPIWEHAGGGNEFAGDWRPGGPWSAGQSLR